MPRAARPPRTRPRDSSWRDAFRRRQWDHHPLENYRRPEFPKEKRRLPAPFRRSRAALFAVELLLHLAALLRLDRERGGRACEQALDADGLAGLLAVAVAAVVDAGERLVDLLEQLALAVAGAQLQGVLLLEGGAVGRIRRER